MPWNPPTRLLGLSLAAWALCCGGCGKDAEPGSAPRALAAPGTPGAPAARAETPAGKRLYLANCAMCHGPLGRGDGAIAPHLPNPPRGLVSEPWQTFPSANAAEERAGLARVVQTGVIERGMPAVGAAWPQADIDAVVEYVLTLRAGATGP